MPIKKLADVPVEEMPEDDCVRVEGGSPLDRMYGRPDPFEPPDPVAHPSHYTRVPGIECIEVTRHFDFNRGNAIKYIWRAGAKDPSKEVEDLRKAIWYLEDEIRLIEGSR